MTAPYQAFGHSLQCRIATETTYGTDPGTGTVIPVISCGVSDSGDLLESEVLGGNLNPRAPVASLPDAGGDLVVPLDLPTLAVIMPLVLSSGLKTGAAIPSFTLGKGIGDLGSEWRYPGCKVSKFTLALEVGGKEGRCTLSITGNGGVTNAAFTRAADPVLTMLMDFHATLTEGGAALPNGTKITITLDTGLDLDNANCRPFPGNGLRGAIPQGRCALSITLTTLLRDTTLWTKANAGTESAIILTMTRPAGGSLVLTMPSIIYKPKSPIVNGPKGILYDLDGQAGDCSGSGEYALGATITQAGA